MPSLFPPFRCRGDWYPERNWFQVGIAFMSGECHHFSRKEENDPHLISSCPALSLFCLHFPLRFLHLYKGPRILLVLLSSLLVSLSNPTAKSIFKQKAFFLFMVGTLRTVACAGWVYVTSSDDHDFHDIAMGLYLILTPPWMYVCSGSLVVPPSKKNKDSSNTDRDEKARKAKKMRLISSLSFFACIPFMVYFFIKHKVDKIPGAYSYYAYFEWGLIVFDLLFDAASVYDLSRLEIQIVEARQSSSLSKSCKPVAGTWAEAGSAGSISSGAWSSSVANPSTSQKEEKRDETKK